MRKRPLLIWTLLLLLPLLAAGALLVYFTPVRALNALGAAAGGYTSREGVPYGPLARQRLDLYIPDAKAPAGGWPMVVFFYGGAWNSGARSDSRFIAASLATHGVLTVVADYRLYPEVRYPEFLRDSAQALAYGLTEGARLGANPKRIFVMGHSAGAYNAAMLALDPRWLGATGHAPNELAGWIGLAGPYDFFPTDNAAARPVFFHPNYPANAQPIAHASASAPRTFLAAPINDTVVNPTRNTQGLGQRLQSAGASVSVKMYEHANHTTLIAAMAWPLRWIAPVHADVLAFINESAPARERPGALPP